MFSRYFEPLYLQNCWTYQNEHGSIRSSSAPLFSLYYFVSNDYFISIFFLDRIFAKELLFRGLSAALVLEFISSILQQVPPWAVLQALVLAVRLVLAVGLAVTGGRARQLGWLRQLGELWLRPVGAAAHQDFHLGSLDHPCNFCTCLKFCMILYRFVPFYDVVLQTSSTVIKNK